MWFIKNKLLWDSLKAKEGLQLLSEVLGSVRLESPIWAISSKSCFCFFQSIRSGDRVSLGGQSCPDSREVCLLQLSLRFSLNLVPACTLPLCHRLLSASLGELSISHRCSWALIPAVGCQWCRAAFGVLHDAGGGRAQGAPHLNYQSLDFLTYKTILVYLGLVVFLWENI